MIVELLYYPPPYGRSISLGLFEADNESDADDLCELYSKEWGEEVFWTEYVQERSLFEEIKEGFYALKGGNEYVR